MLTTEKDVVPIKTFVHKVLSRSRTTCSVLQSALCYIEAVRSRVPELVELERSDKGIRGEPDLTSRITKASDELSIDSLIDTDKYSSSLPTELMNTTIMDPSSQGTTLCPTDVVLEPCETAPMSCADLAESATKHMKRPFPTLLALPPLPSPLLCPRRTFLAALILASKFLQDRCYSNRAWAKLSGLPAREVGRCERALGDALQ